MCLYLNQLYEIFGKFLGSIFFLNIETIILGRIFSAERCLTSMQSYICLLILSNLLIVRHAK